MRTWRQRQRKEVRRAVLAGELLGDEAVAHLLGAKEALKDPAEEDAHNTEQRGGEQAANNEQEETGGRVSKNQKSFITYI